MSKKYILGVDGGNTKTHYFLFNEHGYVDHLRAGTCSHEQFDGSYEQTESELKVKISELLSRNSLSPSDIKAAVFGLAGADFVNEKQKLGEIIGGIGFNNYIVDNDGYLGLKAGSFSGIGVCSVNGTGVVTVGVNKSGSRVQIGGIGKITGDYAGGVYIAERALEYVYNELYRCGEQTEITPYILKLFNVKNKNMFHEKVVQRPISKAIKHLITKEVFLLEKQKDNVSTLIMREIGNNLARSAAGCVKELGFSDQVDIVLSGSVWTKGNSDNMQNAFINEISSCCQAELNIIKLMVPPVVGAILWGYELIGENLSVESKLLINKDIKRRKIL